MKLYQDKYNDLIYEFIGYKSYYWITVDVYGYDHRGTTSSLYYEEFTIKKTLL